MVSLVLRLALHRIAFLRPAEKRRLEEAVEGGLELGGLRFSELELLVGRLLKARSWKPRDLLALAVRDAELLGRGLVRYIPQEDPEYPPLLREIHDPPYGLFAIGARLRDSRPSVAVVGTRRATGLGMRSATSFGRELALAGIPVVSGLARGIDAAAHRGALAAERRGGSPAPTVAVLPVGIDSIYPPSHRGLAAAIVGKGGTLVSEYSPGEGPGTWRFPERNRIIAGMARATIVVEAPSGSGALITSTHALDAGRDVYVASATLGGPMNAGAEALAAEGARHLDSARSLLEEWGLAVTEGGGEFLAGDEAELPLADALRAELGLLSEDGRGDAAGPDLPWAGEEGS